MKEIKMCQAAVVTLVDDRVHALCDASYVDIQMFVLLLEVEKWRSSEIDAGIYK